MAKAKQNFKAATVTKAQIAALELQVETMRADIRHQVRDNVSVENRADAELEAIRAYYRDQGPSLFFSEKVYTQQEIETLALADMTPDKIQHHGRNNLFTREMDALLAEEPNLSLFRMNMRHDQTALENLIHALNGRGWALISRSDQSAATAVRQSYDERKVLYDLWQERRLAFLSEQTALQAAPKIEPLF